MQPWGECVLGDHMYVSLVCERGVRECGVTVPVLIHWIYEGVICCMFLRVGNVVTCTYVVQTRSKRVTAVCVPYGLSEPYSDCTMLRFSSTAGVQFWILDKWRHLQVLFVHLSNPSLRDRQPASLR